MAINLIPGGGWFEWLGDKVKRAINRHIDDNMHRTGRAVVARAQQLAPVDTGALRASIYYLVQYDESGGKHTLHVRVEVPYAIFQEFGTRNIRPHPYLRPAINEVGRIWGFNVAMGFMAPQREPWHGLIATTGGGFRQAGFAASVSPRWRSLTQKQVHHVEHKLIPSVKAHHRGNVKRARMYVG